MQENTFRDVHQKLQLSHHPFKRSFLYLNWAFKHIDFSNKSVLDIGGGNGIYSYYAKYKGAASCLNLEPLGAGSGNVHIPDDSKSGSLSIQVENATFQDFESDSRFDVIILHDSINHLDEENYRLIHKNKDAYNLYSGMVSKIGRLLAPGGKVVVSDCSRINFFALLGVRNPLAPSIEWDLHQHPSLLVKLFDENGMKLEKLRWSPFKRFDRFGQFLSNFGFPVSYFMQSHFNMVFALKD